MDVLINNIPKEFSLYSSYPNPFNPYTTITYGIAEPGNVLVEIYDIMGRKISELDNSFKLPGKYSIVWNAESFNSGLYFIKCSSNSKIKTQKIVFIK